MRQGTRSIYRGQQIRRETNTPTGRRRYRAVHYVRILDPTTYRTECEAKEAIDAAIADEAKMRRAIHAESADIWRRKLEEVKREGEKTVAAARAQTRAAVEAAERIASERLGPSGFEHAVEFRGARIVRIEDASDGTRRYKVDGMGVFTSIDAAVSRIDWKQNSLERLERTSAETPGGWKRNNEK
jgi:hypothetical protein